MNPGSPEKENLFEKGEQRYEKISDSLSKAKSKVSGWWNSAKSSVGGLFKRTSVGVLSTPEVAGKAWDVSRDATLDTIAAADEKIHQGIDYVGTKAGEGLQWADNKLDQVTAWSFDKAGKLEDWIVKKYEHGKEVAAMTAYVGVAAGAFAVERTQAAYEKVKGGLSEAYGTAVEYGKNAVEAAQMKKQQITDKWNLFKNSMKIGFARVAAEEAKAKYDSSVEEARAQYETSVEAARVAYENLQKKNDWYEKLLAKQSGQKAPEDVRMAA